MKIIKPAATAQSIVLDTRFYPQSSIVLELINEATEEVLIVANTYITLNGVTTVSFDLDTLEGDRFQIKITEGNHVVYRGKAFCTDQDPQDYKLTDNRYIY
jgi:hypothetical protein